MTVDTYTLVKAIFALDDGASDFSDDESPTESTRGAIALAAKLSGTTQQEIYDQLRDFAQGEEDAQRAEDELQYGALDQDGNFPHEAN